VQVHWLGFGQIQCSSESVPISASTNWFFQGKSQKNNFVYTQMRELFVVYIEG
jgi:hypothetical protein